MHYSATYVVIVSLTDATNVHIHHDSGSEFAKALTNRLSVIQNWLNVSDALLEELLHKEVLTTNQLEDIKVDCGSVAKRSCWSFNSCFTRSVVQYFISA